jgi:hypothetical protein
LSTWETTRGRIWDTTLPASAYQPGIAFTRFVQLGNNPVENLGHNATHLSLPARHSIHKVFPPGKLTQGRIWNTTLPASAFQPGIAYTRFVHLDNETGENLGHLEILL